VHIAKNVTLDLSTSSFYNHYLPVLVDYRPQKEMKKKKKRSFDSFVAHLTWFDIFFFSKFTFQRIPNFVFFFISHTKLSFYPLRCRY